MMRSLFLLVLGVSASLVLLWVGVLVYTSTNPFNNGPWTSPAAAGTQRSPGS